jgi:UDP-glucose 4-epimerase
VRVLDNLSTGQRVNIAQFASHVQFIQADIADASQVAGALSGVDCVFHQAALASVPRSVEDPLATHAACATGTLTLLDAARRAGIRRFIYAGSSSAYGDSAWSSKREMDLPAALSPYAAAKLAGEQYCQAFFHCYGLETVCLRYFNVFGPRQDPAGAYAAVVPRYIAALLAGERPMVFGDGKQSRDFTYVENVVQANLLAAAAPGVGGQTFNIAMGSSISLLELIGHLERLLNRPVTPDFQPPRAGDVRDSLADIRLARQYLGYEPQIGLEEGLRRTIAAFQAAAT